jgi:hypothetical protein
MKRRTFISISLTGVAASTLPLSQCNNDIERPASLVSILSKDQIKDIGKAYIDQFPSEGHKDKLSTLLATKQNTTMDFQIKQTVIVQGWILSVTEARQSALYYLNS